MERIVHARLTDAQRGVRQRIVESMPTTHMTNMTASYLLPVERVVLTSD
jgi:hypothetical protein